MFIIRLFFNQKSNQVFIIRYYYEACNQWRDAFLCNVPSTSRTLHFSDKAWVYERPFVQDCNDCSMAQWLGAQRIEGSAALTLGSISSRLRL